MNGSDRIIEAPLIATERSVAAPSLYRRREDHILAGSAVVAFLVLWEVLPALGLVNPLFTSSPSRIVAAARWLAANGLWDDVVISVTEFAAGFSLAVLVGVPLGILLGWYHRWRAVFNPFISVLYVTPRVALLPLLILWLGIGLAPKIAVVFLGAFFPIVITVIAGMRTIDETLLMCARSFGARPQQIFSTIALPSCVPFVVAGLRLGVGRALVGVIVGEMVASTGGIGHMMSVAGATLQTDKVFVGIMLIASFGIAMNWGLNRLERRFENWRPERS
jgi:NitT/TauT family transport system permease protein